MIELQKLIDWIEVEKSKCQEKYLEYQSSGNEEGATQEAVINMTFGLVLQQARLLLKKTREQQP